MNCMLTHKKWGKHHSMCFNDTRQAVMSRLPLFIQFRMFSVLLSPPFLRCFRRMLWRRLAATETSAFCPPAWWVDVDWTEKFGAGLFLIGLAVISRCLELLWCMDFGFVWIWTEAVCCFYRLMWLFNLKIFSQFEHEVVAFTLMKEVWQASWLSL